MNYLIINKGTTTKCNICSKSVIGSPLEEIDPIYSWSGSTKIDVYTSKYTTVISYSSGVTYKTIILYRIRNKTSNNNTSNNSRLMVKYANNSMNAFGESYQDSYNNTGRIRNFTSSYYCTTSKVTYFRISLGGTTESSQIVDIYRIYVYDSNGNVYINRNSIPNLQNFLESYQNGIYYYTPLLSSWAGMDSGGLTYNGAKTYLYSPQLNTSSSSRVSFIDVPSGAKVISQSMLDLSYTYSGLTGNIFVIQPTQNCNISITLYDKKANNVNLSGVSFYNDTGNKYTDYNDTGKKTTSGLPRTVDIDTYYSIFINGVNEANYDIDNETTTIHYACKAYNTIAIKMSSYKNRKLDYSKPADPTSSYIGYGTVTISKSDYLSGFTKVYNSTTAPFYTTRSVYYNGSTHYYGYNMSGASLVDGVDVIKF